MARRLLPAWMAALLGAAALAHGAHAQVVFDGTFGPAGAAPTATPGGTDWLVDQDRGQRVTGGGRAHLFHSFSLFDLPAGSSATFRATDPVDAVIARVTSGQPSTIAGLVRSEIAGADLFLLNPAGVVFTDTAAIDVPASFHVSTADFLRFEDGTAFDVRAPAPQVTAAPPSAFGFAAGPAGAIDLAGPAPFQVPTGETLTAVGGAVRVGDGAVLIARQGRIQLGATGDAAVEVPIDLADWNVDYGQGDALGAIEVEGSALDTLDFDFAAPPPSQGRIVIRGGSLRVADSDVTAAGDGSGAPAIDVAVRDDLTLSASLLAAVGDPRQAIDGIRLEADSIVLRDQPVRVQVETFGAGAGGDVVIEAGELRLQDAALIETHTDGEAPAGDVTIRVERLEVGTASRIASRTTASGFTGNDAGDVRIVGADSVWLHDGGQISASTTGSGHAGDVSLEGVGEVRLEGRFGDIVSGFPSAILSRSGSAIGDGTTGDGGLISIDARTLDLSGGAQISTRSFGVGDAGSITITTSGAVTLVGEGVPDTPTTGISTIGLSGATGSVDIRASEVRVSERAFVRSQALFAGNAGDVTMQAGEIRLHGAVVETNSAAALGGTILLEADGTIEIAEDSLVTTDVDGASGQGGDVVLQGNGVVVNDSVVTANANDANAAAGNIFITASGGYFESTDATVVAENAFGLDGEKVVNGPINQVVGDLVPLESDFLDASASLEEACAARDSDAGTFSVQRSRAPPPPPDQVLDPHAPIEIGGGRCAEAR